jgi:hypothetical protein
MFRISKVLHRSPRPVYELEDLRGEPIDGRFYAQELTRIKITKRTENLVDKILDTGVRRGIREQLVTCRYGLAFDSWYLLQTLHDSHYDVPHSERGFTRLASEHELKVPGPTAESCGTVAKPL